MNVNEMVGFRLHSSDPSTYIEIFSLGREIGGFILLLPCTDFLYSQLAACGDTAFGGSPSASKLIFIESHMY